MQRPNIVKLLLIFAGSISLILGVVGIFLPLLPTIPFLLLSAFLYAKSSKKLYNWLLNHKYLGVYIRDFREHRAIPLRTKVISILLLWITMAFSACKFVPYIWVKLLMLLIAIAVTIHILSFKTKK